MKRIIIFLWKKNVLLVITENELFTRLPFVIIHIHSSQATKLFKTNVKEKQKKIDKPAKWDVK